MKILFLAHLFPLPLESGGKIKSYHTLKALASRHDVHLLAFTRGDDDPEHLSQLQDICSGITLVPLRHGRMQQAWRLLSGAVSGSTFIISRDFRTQMQREYYSLLTSFQPDVVHIDHLQMAQFVDFRAAHRSILDNHNVEHEIIRRISQTSASRAMRTCAHFEWSKLRRYELDICRQCDLVLAVSATDAATLHALDPNLRNIIPVPIGVDTEYFQPVERDEQSKKLLSIGTMYWPPNVDSMLYFVHDIFPLIREREPLCTLTIAGQKPEARIRALAADPGVKVTGYVEDERVIARQCGAFIVPLRSGSGVRVKILNAMAMGLPIISTSVGAEGLNVCPGKHLLIADDPASFAQAVLSIINNPVFASELGRNARNLACSECSWEKTGELLLTLYKQLEPREVLS